MPDFNADHLSERSAVPYVFSIMVFPTDEEARRAFAQTLLAGGMAEALARPSSRGRSVDAAFAGWLGKAPRLRDVLGDRRMEAVEAATRFVGWVLSFILRAAEHGHPELASVGAVLRGASERLWRARKRGSSVETLKAAWNEYKCVAHLWLADRCVGADGFERCAEDYRLLPVFLGGAEELRRRGEAWVPRRARQPILDSAEAWKVPSSFPLPAVAVPLPPPHPDDLRMVSRGKRQRQW